MQEFSSVTASSYDAGSLTPLLNEKSAAGWTVVSIVSAGTSIVAYLSRDTDDLTEELLEEAVVEEAAAEELLGAAVVEEAVAEELLVEAAVEEAVAEELLVEAAVEEAAAETPSRPSLLQPSLLHLRPPRSPQCRPGGTPTRRGASNCATGTAPHGPSTCHAPASSSPILPSPDRLTA